jgi:regulatory protein
MGFNTLSLKGRALRLLAQREHSRPELISKLKRHVQEGDDLPAVLDELEAKGFIDESRVAESLVHRRAPRLGTQRVLQEMRSKGVGEDTIRAATQQLRETEPARALAVWQSKFGTLAETPEQRMKQMRFLAARGFSAEVVRRVVRGDCEEPEDGG